MNKLRAGPIKNFQQWFLGQREEKTIPALLYSNAVAQPGGYAKAIESTKARILKIFVVKSDFNRIFR